MRLSKWAAAALAVVAAAVVLSNGIALAKKGGKGGGGGGSGAPRYTIVKLDDADGAFVWGNSGAANDINERGHVVGNVADAASGASVAAFWQVTGT